MKLELSALRYELVPYGTGLLGKGAYSNVYKATGQGPDGGLVAIKKSRVSLTVKRPMLQHESRVLQLLRGHPAIPVFYGYRQLEHFEYLAMEILGPSIAELKEDGAGVTVNTALRVVDQILAALDHIHSFNIVHRDIKPENILSVLDHSGSTIKVIDFGISKSFSPAKSPSKYDPLNDRRRIVGSLYWASLNSHEGLGNVLYEMLSTNLRLSTWIDLSPRDDLESFSFVAFYLLRGSLPWKPRPHLDPLLRSQEIVRRMKLACSGPILSEGFPSEFGELLSYSRSLPFGQLPDYVALRQSFSKLAATMGCSVNEGPLDWMPCYPNIMECMLADPDVSIPHEEDEEDGSDSDLVGDSYYGYDISDFERQGERDKDVTLPLWQKAKLDDTILPIEVDRQYLDRMKLL